MSKKLLLTFSLLFTYIFGQSQSFNFTSVDSLLNANLSTIFHNKLICMVSHNDSLIYYYHQGGDSLTTGGVASVTKTLSAALMLRLAQEGTIGLDDSIATYYPFTTALGKGAITIRQLFAHTSGLSGTTNYNSDANINLQQSADSILRNDFLIYTPIGTKFQYTGEDQQVAGAAAELAAGMSWDSLFNIKIAQPLALSNTSFYLSSPTNPRIAGGIKTNAADMMRYGKFILHNGKNEQGIQVVDSVYMQELWRDQTNHAFQIGSPYPYNSSTNNPYNSDTVYYSIGTWLDIYNPTRQYQEQISADGAFGGIIWINRCTNTVGVFLTFLPTLNVITYPITTQAMDIFRDAVPNTCYTTLATSFLGLNATRSGSKSVLKWSTATEQNSSYFNVQRSTDGINFTTQLGRINAAGNSNMIKYYEFEDFAPMAKRNYYRVEEVDFDGTKTLSNIATVLFEKNANIIMVYPNPASRSQLNVDYNSSVTGNLQLQFIDSKGLLVMTRNITVTTGRAVHSVDIGKLIAGIYMVRYVEPDGNFSNIKLIKL